ncbi:P-loop containing nucleoside triphosphate hydrolase protein, partial [Cyathus striatus]
MACTSQNFVGQEIYLERLHEYFSKSNNMTKSGRKMFLLHGMGGIGKTQICLKFCDEMAEYFSDIFWIDTTSEDTVMQSLKDIYKQKSSPVVLNQISSLKHEWLVIFDNADGAPEIVEKFLPPGDVGNILITSRNHALKRITTHKNSMELLLKTKYRKEAELIVKEMHYLPLAIDMAGAYITQTQCDLNDFIKYYNKYRPKILNNIKFQGSSKYNKTVYKTWEISIEKILEMCNNTQDKKTAASAQYAICLLNIFAFMHNENIHETIFERAVKYYSQNRKDFTHDTMPTYISTMDRSILNMDEQRNWNDWQFSESIGLLLSFSLSTYNMHPLVQLCCEDRLSLTEKRLWILNTAGLILSSVSHKEISEEYHVLHNQGKYRNLYPEIYYDDIFKISANILNNCGKHDVEEKYRLIIAQHNLGELVTVKNNIFNAMNDLETKYLKEYDNLNPIVSEKLKSLLSIVQHLSDTYWYQGNWKDAEKLEIQLVEMRIRILGQEHPDTITSMANLASTYRKEGRWNDAEKLQIQVMEMRIRILGRWNDAEKLQIQVMGMSIRILGQEHPHTITSMANLAAIYRKEGRWNDAEKLDIQVMEMRIRILGQEHPDTITSMASLAATYRKEGRWNDAEKLQIQ